jgi:hypothetical protein
MFALTLKSVRGRMCHVHRVRHVGTRVLCTVPPPRACGSRSPIDNRILPRKIKETVLRSAPVSGKSLGPLLPHPSVESLHRLVTSQMSHVLWEPSTRNSPSRTSTLSASTDTASSEPQRKHVRIDDRELFYILSLQLRVRFDEVPRQTRPGELSALVLAGAAHGTARERTARAGVGDR